VSRHKSEADTLFANPLDQVDRFRFDEQVATVFADMIGRSVPGYDLTLKMIGVIAAHFAQPDSACYDLGCSLGAATLAMRQRVPGSCRIIAVDNSAAMTQRCRHNVDKDVQPDQARVDVLCADILQLAIHQASMVTLNFTLQFIAAEKRLDLLASIHQGLNSGGVLVLSEKIALAGDHEQQLFQTLHHDFKRTMGYSDLEVAQKRAALEQVLVPDTIDTHKERLHRAGFREVYTWFQCVNFASWLAIK
jgi:tRNA (cmo5U34)-methyltransferase